MKDILVMFTRGRNVNLAKISAAVAVSLALLLGNTTTVYAAAQAAPATGINPVVFCLVLFVVTAMIGVIAVLGGVGGGVVFTPLMMGLTPIDSYIIRATGLLIALAGGLNAARPFLSKGLANMKLLLFAAVPYTGFAVLGALLAGYTKATMGATGEALVRLILGLLVIGIALVVLLGGKRVEYPQVKRVDKFTQKLALGTAYWEGSLRDTVNYELTRAPVAIVLFCLVGVVSGLFGLGAGWAIVPVLNLVMLAPLKIAAASSVVLISIGDTGAIWPYLTTGGIFPLLAVPCVVGMVFGTTIGTKLMPRVRAGYIRWLVIGIMFISAGKLVFDGLKSLIS